MLHGQAPKGTPLGRKVLPATIFVVHTKPPCFESKQEIALGVLGIFCPPAARGGSVNRGENVKVLPRFYWIFPREHWKWSTRQHSVSSCAAV